MTLTEMHTRLDVIINVNGGGFTGQAGACNQGVARALKSMFGLQTRKTAAEGQPVDEAIQSMGQEAPRLRLPHPRRPHEGTQEVRPQGCPQVVPVLQALIAAHGVEKS